MAEAIFRVGHQFPQFGGIDRDSDPAAIAVHRFRNAVNVRLVGKITNRGGQEKLNPDSAITGCVNGIFGPEYQFPRVSGRVMAIPSVAAVEGSSGSPIALAVDTDAHEGDAFQVDLPDVVRLNLDPTFVLNYAYAITFNGFVMGTHNSLRRLAPVALVSFPTGPGNTGLTFITSLAVIGSNLYIGGFGPPGESSSSTPLLYKWNGTDTTLTDANLENAFGLFDEWPYPAVVSLGVYNSAELIASVGDPVGLNGYGLFRRSSLGVWSEPSMPGSTSEFYARGFATLGAKLYMCGTSFGLSPKSGQILSWDGAALTLEHTIAPLDSATPVIIGAMAVSGTTLYYLWSDRGRLRIGSFDGVSTWVDNVKDLSSLVTFAASGVQNNMPVALWIEDGITYAVAILGVNDYSAQTLYFLHAGGLIASTWVIDYAVNAGVFSWVQQHPQAV